MSFKEDFPDYKSFEDDDYYYSTVPTGLNGALSGLISRYAATSNTLKRACHEIAGLIPCEPTQNWGRDWLLGDLDSLLRQLSQKSFHKYMDFLEWLGIELSEDLSLDELNEILKEYGLGYKLINERHSPIFWQLINDITPTSKPLLEAKEEIKDICQQAAAHLQKAKEHLQNSSDMRARKDALRDSLSAMESMIKKLSETGKIEDGIKYLRDNNWGSDIVVKDGLGIWNRIHDLYPDVRHGSPTVTDLSLPETFYWIERIIAYVTYLQRKQKELP